MFTFVYILVNKYINMPKLRDIVSDLAIDAKALNIDDRISFRYLANKFISRISYYIRLEGRSREITRNLSVWKPINCIELIDIAPNTCGFVDNCNTLKRSKEKLPKPYDTSYGGLIKIMVLDKSREVKLIKPNDYKAYTTGKFMKNNLYGWIQDDYLYVPNTDIEQLTGMLVPKNPADVDALNSNCTTCVYPLEGEVNYTDYLIDLAKRDVMQDLQGGYRRMVSDEKGDDNNNIKN